MACCLCGAKPLSKPMMNSHHQSYPKDQISMKKTINFHWQIALKFIVCSFTAILSRGGWVNTPHRAITHPCRSVCRGSIVSILKKTNPVTKMDVYCNYTNSSLFMEHLLSTFVDIGLFDFIISLSRWSYSVTGITWCYTQSWSAICNASIL